MEENWRTKEAEPALVEGYHDYPCFKGCEHFINGKCSLGYYISLSRNCKDYKK